MSMVPSSGTSSLSSVSFSRTQSFPGLSAPSVGCKGEAKGGGRGTREERTTHAARGTHLALCRHRKNCQLSTVCMGVAEYSVRVRAKSSVVMACVWRSSFLFLWVLTACNGM